MTDLDWRDEIAFIHDLVGKSIQLDWVILPRGWLHDRRLYIELFARQKHPYYEFEEKWTVLKFVDEFGPRQWYRGMYLGKTWYFVAEFEAIAIADSLECRNALYYYPARNGDWRAVFRLTKQGARDARADRLWHHENWQEKLTTILYDHGVPF